MEKTNGWDALGLEFNANVLLDWSDLKPEQAEHELILLLANLSGMWTWVVKDVKDGNEDAGPLIQAASSLHQFINKFESVLRERSYKFYEFCSDEVYGSSEKFAGRYALILAVLAMRELKSLIAEMQPSGEG